MIKKIIAAAAGLLMIFVSYKYFDGGNPKDVFPKHNFEVVAHRGVHQNYKKGIYDRITGCEAKRIFKPTHEYIENTIESMTAAFSFGATIVEIDIRCSSDNHLVVFHDWMLECRTNGKGRVSDYPLEYLKRLDIGYGYTYDSGKTYPFRGKWVGKMPTLVEVLQRFPDKKFLINQKDDSMKTTEILINIIKSLPLDQQRMLYYWGADKTYEYIHKEIPAVTRLFCTRHQIIKWIVPYLLTFGLSDFPEESRGLAIGMSSRYAKFIWGWPYRFLKSVNEAGAQFYLVIDTEEDAKKFSDIPIDGILTDYIELIGKYFTDKIYSAGSNCNPYKM